jgi:hypothetical protein
MRRTLFATLIVAAVATATAAPAVTAHAAGPTAAQTVAAADALGVGAQARRLQDHFLPGARLVATGGHAALGATRLGGAPDLPRTAKWPSCNRHPLTFVGQLALRDVRAAVPGATRGTGLLSIFMGTRAGADGAPEAVNVFAVKGLARVGKVKCFAVEHTPAAVHLTRRTPARGSSPFPAAAQRLRPVLTVPGWEIAGDRMGVSFLSDDPAFDAWSVLQDRAAAGTLGASARDLTIRQVLGWSRPLDRDPTMSTCAGQRTRLLLQFDSVDRYDLDQTEGGSLMLAIGADDLRAGRFDRLCVEHQLD